MCFSWIYGRISYKETAANLNGLAQVRKEKEQSYFSYGSGALRSTRKRDEEKRIIFMKSKNRRTLDFNRIMLSSSFLQDFITNNGKI